MGTLKGTKGEWRNSLHVNKANEHSIYSSNGTTVAIIQKDITKTDCQEFKANAKLIVSAPELLEVLQKLWVARNLTSVQEDLIEKAINNAL